MRLLQLSLSHSLLVTQMVCLSRLCRWAESAVFGSKPLATQTKQRFHLCRLYDSAATICVVIFVAEGGTPQLSALLFVARRERAATFPVERTMANWLSLYDRQALLLVARRSTFLPFAMILSRRAFLVGDEPRQG